MRWALIGASDIAATRVVPAMRALGHEVVGVMSSHAGRGRDYATANRLTSSTADLTELLGWDCDAVYISTTNQLHAEQAIASAARGKHVLCEKPLALSVAEARRIVDACAAAGVTLGTNHHLRGSAVISRIRDLVRGGDIGELRAMRVHHAVSLPERLRGWRLTDRSAGGGVVLDITVHDADTLRYVTGQEITAVSAVIAAQQLAQGGIEDTAMCVMTLDSGALAMTHESFAVPHAYTALEVHGSLGSIYGRGVLTQDPIGDIELRRDGNATVVDVGDRPDLYQVGLSAFEQAVRGSAAPLCSGEDGIASLAVSRAALASAEQGRTVTVNEILDGSNG